MELAGIEDRLKAFSSVSSGSMLIDFDAADMNDVNVRHSQVDLARATVSNMDRCHYEHLLSEIQRLSTRL